MTNQELIDKVVRDIHTSDQNPIESFNEYTCTSYAILYNLINGTYKYSQDQFIQVCVNLENLKQNSIDKLTKEFN